MVDTSFIFRPVLRSNCARVNALYLAGIQLWHWNQDLISGTLCPALADQRGDPVEIIYHGNTTPRARERTRMLAPLKSKNERVRARISRG
jgi:hypothetical protein